MGSSPADVMIRVRPRAPQWSSLSGRSWRGNRQVPRACAIAIAIVLVPLTSCGFLSSDEAGSGYSSESDSATGQAPISPPSSMDSLAGPTTLPSETVPQTSWVPPTTLPPATTVPPPAILPLPPDQDDAVCGAFVDVVTLIRIVGLGAVDGFYRPDEVRAELTSIIDRAAASDQAQQLSRAIAYFAEIARAIEQDPTPESIRSNFARLLQPAPETAFVREYVAAECPEVLTYRDA